MADRSEARPRTPSSADRAWDIVLELELRLLDVAERVSNEDREALGLERDAIDIWTDQLYFALVNRAGDE
jgi:hypothetical protein